MEKVRTVKLAKVETKRNVSTSFRYYFSAIVLNARLFLCTIERRDVVCPPRSLR
jgi:hypothetical protein